MAAKTVSTYDTTTIDTLLSNKATIKSTTQSISVGTDFDINLTTFMGTELGQYNYFVFEIVCPYDVSGTITYIPISFVLNSTNIHTPVKCVMSSTYDIGIAINTSGTDEILTVTSNVGTFDTTKDAIVSVIMSS